MILYDEADPASRRHGTKYCDVKIVSMKSRQY